MLRLLIIGLLGILVTFCRPTTGVLLRLDHGEGESNEEQVVTTKLPLDKNLAIGISGTYLQSASMYFSLVSLKLGILPSSSLNGEDIRLSVNFTDDRVLVVNASQEISGFGVSCSTEYSCFAPPGFPDQCEFNHATYNSQNATSLLRFKELSLPQGFVTAGQPFQLVRPVDDWYHAYGNIGILGLSPRSSFWPYLVDQYMPTSQGSLVTSVSYAIKNPENMLQPSQALLQTSFLTINGRYSTNPMVVRNAVNVSSGVWLYTGVNVWISPNLSYNNTTLCVDNNANYYLMFESRLFQDVLSEFNNEVCGQPTACNYSNSNLQDVLGFKVRFPDPKSSFGVQFTGEELVQFDSSGNPLYGLGDLAGTSCDGQAEIAVGRWFLTKAEFSVVVSRNDLPDGTNGLSFQVGFSQLYLQAKSTKALLIIFIVAFGLIFVSVVVVMCIQVMPMLKRRKTQKLEEKLDPREEH